MSEERTKIQILDSTLREGEQTPGVCFPVHAKLAIARKLDALGIDIIEAGHPVVSPRIEEATRRISQAGCNATIAAHARSIEDDVMRALDCGVDFVGIFYCVRQDRLDGVFKTDIASAIRQISRVIRYAKEQKPDLIVRYTPEDTVRSKWENVIDAAVAAVEAGADVISIADTTGVMIPRVRSMYDYVLRLRENLDARGCNPMIAVHCHNDRGVALANAIEAYEAGANIIDTTVLGLGERTGIVDMAQLLTMLATEYDHDSWNLKELPALYELVSRYSGVPISLNFPVMGGNAFTHCAGVHTHAAMRSAVHYQSLDPSLIDKEMEVSLDHMSGISSVQFALDKIGEQTDDLDLVKRVLAQVKAVGESGRRVNHRELRDIYSWCQQ